MKHINRVAIAGLAVATLAGGGLLTQAVSAQSSMGGTGLADLIAKKFNLKSEDVQAVIKDYRQTHEKEREQDHQAMMTKHLDQAVTDGKITSAQKDLIVAKQAEMKTKMDEIRSMTNKDAQKTAMDQMHTDMKAWAEQNGIPTDFMGPMGGRGPGGRGGHGMGHGMMDRDNDATNDTTGGTTKANTTNN